MKNAPINIRRYLALAVFAWTAAIAVTLSQYIYQERSQALEFAKVQARSALNKDLSYRRWNAMHGGVYVPITEDIQPNPYLMVPNRDVTTTDGVELTLVNPAYMTRQVHELSRELYGERGHITSLNPIRPQNKADEWETRALENFETGATEASSEETIDGEPYLRYMIPLVTEEGCLKCHAVQGYKLGDIRGGLSIDVLMEPYLTSYKANAWRIALGYGVLWLLGVAGILAAGARINRQVDEIRILNAMLEQRVEERTRELREAQDRLLQQEKFALLGKLADGVGHELRNPLGVISNAVYFLKMAQPDANPKVKEYLGLIEKHVNVSDKIVTDLLNFTLVRAGKPTPISMPEEIQQALERFPMPQNIQTELDLPADLPRAYADPRHTLQILGNLTINAVQSMEEKGGKISIACRAEDGMIRVSVQDTGVGIPPENMEKIFEPLFTTKLKGIGLGLNVSQKLLEANGGRIKVESEGTPGKGSIFTIWLPIFEPEKDKRL